MLPVFLWLRWGVAETWTAFNKVVSQLQYITRIDIRSFEFPDHVLTQFSSPLSCLNSKKIIFSVFSFDSNAVNDQWQQQISTSDQFSLVNRSSGRKILYFSNSREIEKMAVVWHLLTSCSTSLFEEYNSSWRVNSTCTTSVKVQVY